MSTLKWSAGTIQTLLTTELNSLTDGSISSASAAYDNTSGLYMFADFQVDVTFGSNPTAGSPLTLYLLPSLDGTNYEKTGVSGAVVAGWQLEATTSQQLLVARGIVLPPTKFKVQLKNNSGVTTPSSGSTVKMLPYYYQSV